MYKKTFYFLVIPLIFLFITLTILSFWLEPFRGDLTRISGLPSNFYGWTSQQIRFKEPLFDRLKSPAQAQKPYDIIVLGDSFSEDLEHGWINYLAAKTGWSAVRYDIRLVSVDKIINQDYYKKNPPKLFIYQTVERKFYERASKLKTTCISDTKLQKHMVSYPMHPLLSNTEPRPIPAPRAFQFDAPMQLIRQSLKPNSKVLTASLSKKNLFSSTKNKTLLYYYEDLEKFAVDDITKLDARCGLKDLQNLIQQNGKTNFLALIAPDKSNIYSRYIVDGDQYYNDLSPYLAEPLNTINLQKLLSTEIEQGVQDVYLPDDTHWGKAGYQLVGEAVSNYLP